VLYLYSTFSLQSTVYNCNDGHGNSWTSTLPMRRPSLDLKCPVSQ